MTYINKTLSPTSILKSFVLLLYISICRFIYRSINVRALLYAFSSLTPWHNDLYYIKE